MKAPDCEGRGGDTELGRVSARGVDGGVLQEQAPHTGGHDDEGPSL